MSDSPRPPGRPAVVVLFAVAAAALLGASALTAVAIADGGPAGGDPVAVGDRPSPTPRTPTSRAAGLPMCIVGTWRTVEDSLMLKFYTDADRIPFSGAGRRYEFRPDGTATEFQENWTLTGSYQGNELRLVGNGSTEFTWTATDRQVTYLARTKTSVVYESYDQRGHIGTTPQEVKADLNEVDEYTCQGNQFVEQNAANGYRSVWVRVEGTGLYG
ncbi:hypothetical protein AB0A74_09830 [Saccharothrix sp. NPDC042600]|uniref:hypothetical protein n=1 Tax=Saccharothrix TaxID=2071 RepID=UPI0033F6286C|nr:hypothetical protein GCM10017745_41810 [Saccharothrix mutabilis subsp. capreolus]